MLRDDPNNGCEGDYLTTHITVSMPCMLIQISLQKHPQSTCLMTSKRTLCLRSYSIYATFLKQNCTELLHLLQKISDKNLGFFILDV